MEDIKKAILKKDKTSFQAKLHTLDGKRIATGKDFDENTGKIAKGKKVLIQICIGSRPALSQAAPLDVKQAMP